MQAENSDYRLSRITTLWSVVWRAHHGPAEAANSARQQLLERYSSAVRRYLRKLLNDPDAATEVFQEFALLLAHGDLRGADARRGRFRDFVKGTLFHLIADYRAERRKWPALTESDPRTGQHFFVVLRFRAEHPDMRSPGMAQELATLLDRPLTAAGVRQLIHRARERFTEFLIGEVVNELDNPTPGELGKELAALGLLDYCRPSLEAAVRQGLRV
jgi:hypothetical protein